MLAESKTAMVPESEFQALKEENERLKAKLGTAAFENDELNANADAQAAAIALKLTELKGAGLKLLKDIMYELKAEAGAMKRDMVRRWFQRMRGDELERLVINVTELREEIEEIPKLH